MKQQKVILLLVILAVGLTIFLSTGIGYASVIDYSNDDLIQAPATQAFRVKFLRNTTITGEGKADVKFIGDTAAKLNITGLKKAGDSVKIILTIKNTSSDYAATLSKSIKNSNMEYFKVDVDLSDDEIYKANGKATVTITVKLIKTPIHSTQTTNISIKIIASPIAR